MNMEIGVFMLGVLTTVCVQGATIGMYALLKQIFQYIFFKHF